MTRPKKRNPLARKPRSRHSKTECDECGQPVSEASLQAHYEIAHGVTPQQDPGSKMFKTGETKC